MSRGHWPEKEITQGLKRQHECPGRERQGRGAQALTWVGAKGERHYSRPRPKEKGGTGEKNGTSRMLRSWDRSPSREERTLCLWVGSLKARGEIGGNRERQVLDFDHSVSE